MSKPAWQLEVERMQVQLKGYLDATDSYANKQPSVGLYDLYVKIGKLAGEISALIDENIQR